MSAIDVGIIGAGPAGLSLSKFLKSTSEVLEASHTVGGHAASFQRNGFTFDYGPHILFSKNKIILDYLVTLLGDNVNKLKRHNKISFKDRLIKYPFENDLKSLPTQDNFECIRDFIFNDYKKLINEPKNLKEWLLKKFGESICEKYLFPYNEKVWNIPVDQLSMLWADRIPDPNPIDILKSSVGGESEGYLHQLYYYYPKQGGYQAISERLAKDVSIVYDYEIKRITAHKKNNSFTWEVNNGIHTKCYPILASSIPIHTLVSILDIEIPNSIQDAINALIVNPMYIISIALKGIDHNQYTAIYFPESDFLVNRISFPGTFSRMNCPTHSYSIQAEITCSKNSEAWHQDESSIEKHVLDGLIKRNIITHYEDIIFTDIRRQEFAYVVYDHNYLNNVTLIRNYFSSIGIHLIGRFGYFEYLNIDGILENSLKIATSIDHHRVSFEGSVIKKY